MANDHTKKTEQLGISYPTAAHRLRKALFFQAIQRLGETICHRCGKEILTPPEMSIDHVVPWQDSEDPRGLFFDIANVKYSHLSCNSRAAIRSSPYKNSNERHSAKMQRQRDRRRKKHE